MIWYNDRVPTIKNKKNSNIIPPINAFNSRKEWEMVCWGKIAGSGELLQSLITPYERHNLVLRAAARDGLSTGKNYREIGEELWLSPQTISSIKKAITGKEYRSYRESSKTKRKKRKLSAYTGPRRLPRPPGIPRRTKYGILHM